MIESPPKLDKSFAAKVAMIMDRPEIRKLIADINNDYLYWSDVKYKKLPEGITHQELWAAVKLSRVLQRAFRWDRYGINVSVTNRMQQLCHEFDMNFGGSWGNGSIIPGEDREQYLVSSLMEEAISSSQMEGATTTRKVAKDMLRNNLTPRSRSEQMIYNNYNSIRFIVEHKEDPLTPELLLSVHSLMTYKTLEDSRNEGRFRTLVSLVSHDPDCKKMMGLALKNVTLTLFEDGKAIFDEQGEMLFTHFGISGPLTLSASSHLGDMKKHTYYAEIDLKPALSEEQLYDRITRDFALLANHAAQGALVKLLPSSMQPVMVARWGIDPATKANQITREQKRELVHLCKHWKVPIDARGDLAHAVITSGGVSVREVDPKTMQSKKALGLYFAGEVLDVDAYTGGYNLQIAFCTAQSFANNL